MMPKLYKMDLSPPVRSVLLTAAALGITLEHVEIDLGEKDHLKNEFLKLNPQHTIPTLEDDGNIIWDSHAIIVYLVSKYGKDDSLYPNDFYSRAVIDQRLHFDSGVLFALLSNQIIRPMVYRGIRSISEEIFDQVDIAYDFLNKFLKEHDWVAGDNISIADFSLLSSTTSLDAVIPVNPNKYPNIITWIKRAQQLPFYIVNQKGLDDFKTIMHAQMDI